MSQALIAAMCWAALASAPVKNLEGVSIPDHLTVDAKPLVLNGAGARIRIFFKVYAAALYLEHSAKDADAILSEDAARALQLVMIKDQDRKQLVEPIRAAFLQNAPAAQLSALKPKLEKLLTLLPAKGKQGEVLTFTYVPGQGTSVSSNLRTFIPGKDFADAVFSIWLGTKPVDEDLKKALLGS